MAMSLVSKWGRYHLHEKQIIQTYWKYMEVIFSQISHAKTSAQYKTRNMTQVSEILNDINFGVSEISHTIYLSGLKWSGQE